MQSERVVRQHEEGGEGLVGWRGGFRGTEVGPKYEFLHRACVSLYGGLGPASVRIACVDQPDVSRGEGDKRGMKGGGRERRWGSSVTRSDTEPAQNVVCFSPKVTPRLHCGQICF